MVTSLGSFEEIIVAGDQISSVSLLKLSDDKLVSIARDYGPLYPISVEALNSTTIIASNVSIFDELLFWRRGDKPFYRILSMSYYFLFQKPYAEKCWRPLDLSI